MMGWTKQPMAWLLGVALVCAAVPIHAAPASEGFQTAKTFKAETARTVTIGTEQNLGMQNFYGPDNINAQPITLPEWASQSKALKGVLQLGYQVPILTNQPTVLVIDLVSDSPCIKKQPTPLMILAHRDQCKLRILLDLNGDQTFSPNEIKEVNCPTGFANNGPQGDGVVSTDMPISGLTLPGGQAARLQVVIGLTPNWDLFNLSNNPARNVMTNMLPVRLKLSPSLTAPLDILGSSDKLTLTLVANTNGPRITGYQLSNTPCNGNTDPLDKPFRTANKWWMITAVAPDLSSLTVAEPGDWNRNASVDVGTPAPSWSRPDLITRRILDLSDFKGKVLVLTFLSNNSNWQTRYQALGQAAQKLHRAVGDRAQVVAVEDNIQIENFLQQVGGQENPGYSMVLNRDMNTNGPNNNLTNLYQLPQQTSTTIVIGPDGIILARIDSDLAAAMDKVIEAIPPAPQPVATPAPPQQLPPNTIRPHKSFWSEFLPF